MCNNIGISPNVVQCNVLFLSVFAVELGVKIIETVAPRMHIFEHQNPKASRALSMPGLLAAFVFASLVRCHFTTSAFYSEKILAPTSRARSAALTVYLVYLFVFQSKHHCVVI